MVLNRKLQAALTLVGVVGLAVGGQAAAAPKRAADPPGTRTIREGDTLSGLAKALGVSVSSLAQANGISDPHKVRAGVRLTVPGGAAPPNAKPAPAKVPASLPERLKAQPDRLALLPAFDAAAAEFGVPADLFKAMTWLESGWQNDKVSSTRAVGIGQLMPDTIAFVNGNLLRGEPDLDPKKPEHNIRMSARFLAYLLRQNDGNASLALSSYYQGLASVRRQGPLPETTRYVANVLALRPKF